MSIRICLSQSVQISVENRSSVLRALVAGCMCFALFSFSVDSLFGQSGTTAEKSADSGRSNPAPWRPSFGSVGQTAQDRLPAPNNPSTTTQSATTPLATTQLAAGPVNNPATGSGSSATTPASPASSSPLSRQQGDGQSRDARTATITKVTKTMSRLPNDAGQIWREYDISPYTSRISAIEKPQQAILDWILKETGVGMWFHEPFGMMNADRNQLRVYHTPEIQRGVHRIVDRFVNTRAQVQNLQVGLVTVSKPNWRETAYPMLQPIEVKSAGVEAWMINKENAAILMARLQQRSDFKDHGSGTISHNDGQKITLQKTKPVQFVRNLRWLPGSIPNYQPLMTTIDEGYLLEISSLSSIDGRTIDATVKVTVEQVEKLDSIKVDAQGVGGTIDKVNLQIPELVSWRLEERFRWSNDQVLLLSVGVVANPTPRATRSGGLFSGASRSRADALMFIEYRGPQLSENLPAVLSRRSADRNR